jgi:glycosyltransferase involved in cell wall biosynthesis
MKILLLPSRAFLDAERSLLQLLAVGLADEGFAVVHGVPRVSPTQAELRADSLGVFAPPVVYADRGLPFTEGLRARLLTEALERSPSGPLSVAATGSVDLVHVFGQDAWSMAQRVARRAPARLVIEICDKSDVQTASVWLTTSLSQTAVWFNCADAALAQALSAKVPMAAQTRVAVTVSPWGVHVPEHPHKILNPHAEHAIILWIPPDLARTSQPDMFAPLLVALRNRLAKGKALSVLVDESVLARQATKARLLDQARSLGGAIREAICPVPSLYSAIELTHHADMLLIPLAEGRKSTFVLRSLAAGVPTVARADDCASHLRAETSALLVTENTSSRWAEAIDRLLDHPAEASQLSAKARQYVRESALASTWVSAVARQYDAILRP